MTSTGSYRMATFAGVPVNYLDFWDVQTALLDGVVSKKLERQITDYYERVAPPISDKPSLPEDDKERGELILADGLLDYFPNALAAVAKISKQAGDKHHPGEKTHWDRSKSTDHRNKIARHLIDSGKKDKEGNRHSAALAWRALALLQEELEAECGYPAPRNARD